MQRLKLWFGIMTISVMMLFTYGAYAQDDSLLTPLPLNRSFEADPLTLNTSLVKFNPHVLTGRSKDQFRLELFDNRTVAILPTTIEIELEEDAGSLSAGKMLAQVQGYPFSEVIFFWQGAIGGGTINLGNGEIYRLRHLEKGIHIFEQLPAEYLPAGMPEWPVGAEIIDIETQRRRDEEAARAKDEQKITIDVLVLYSGDAQSAMGGEVGSANTLHIAEEESNKGFENSQINVDFRIVHSQKVDIDESAYDFSQMLSILTNGNDGLLDDIHLLRDYYGADIVTFIVDRPLLCGKTYQNNGQYKDFSKFAFVVLHYSCVTGYYSFAHEIGHVMGSQHNREHAGHSGAFSYSHGYRDPAHRFRTIMAYNCEASCTRVNHWSNPNIFYQGAGITGIHLDQPNAAHNSFSLAQMAPSVSQFRNTVLTHEEVTKINFRPEPVDGEDEQIDTGKTFGERSGGLVYGWSENALISAGDIENGTAIEETYISAGSSDKEPVKWEMLLPNGAYNVRIVSGGNLQAEGSGKIIIENEIFLDELDPLSHSENKRRGLDREFAIQITDGILTISALSYQDRLTINLVEITPLLGEAAPGGSEVEPIAIVYLPTVVR